MNGRRLRLRRTYTPSLPSPACGGGLGRVFVRSLLPWSIALAAFLMEPDRATGLSKAQSTVQRDRDGVPYAFRPPAIGLFDVAGNPAAGRALTMGNHPNAPTAEQEAQLRALRFSYHHQQFAYFERFNPSTVSGRAERRIITIDEFGGFFDHVAPEPARTGKERLGGKASDEQRVDDCKVPLELRGSKPRPDACVVEDEHDRAPGTQR
jgi:hypothetical protein